jgi:hypothetical protein
METHKATINRENTKTSLNLLIGDRTLEIVLTEDKPNEVKNVFNLLLLELKKVEFNFELEDSNEDLFYHICLEYISQLNAELSSIYNELKDYDLLNLEGKNNCA